MTNLFLFALVTSYKKAFDRVEWTKLMEILKIVGADWLNRRMINRISINHEAVVKVADGITDRVKIGTGVAQGCLSSPKLFPINVEMMVLALECVEKGVLKDPKFADDQAMVASSKCCVHKMRDSLDATKGYKIKINVTKSKKMAIPRHEKGEIEYCNVRQ